MSIKLKKTQKISLTKQAPSLTQIMCGLGWDLDKQSGSASLYDLDSFAICLNDRGELSDRQDIVYFNNLRHCSGAIIHQGDNLTGIGEGDDEVILVNLSRVPSKITRIVFAVNLYRAVSRQQDFSQIDNAFVRLVDLFSKQELARYNLSGKDYQGMTGMIMAEVHFNNDEWELTAVGKGLKANDFNEIVNHFNLKLYFL